MLNPSKTIPPDEVVRQYASRVEKDIVPSSEPAPDVSCP